MYNKRKNKAIFKNSSLKPLYLDRGDPEGNTISGISKAGINAIHSGKTHYTDPRGTMLLREAIAQDIQEQLKISYNPENEILVTTGATYAIFIAIMTLTSPGDHILIPEICWKGYIHLIRVLNLKITYYPLPFNNPDITPDQWYNILQKKINSKSKILVINSPHNPTGIILDSQWLSILEDISIKYPDLVIISDEVYSEIIYNNVKHISIASFHKAYLNTIMINSFSKIFSMTGWRIGYMAAPLKIIDKILKFHIAINGCTSSISQEAALYAIKNKKKLTKKIIALYQKNRDYLIKEFKRMPLFKCNHPQGTFYLFPDISKFGVNSIELSNQLIQSQNIYVYPGSLFGVSGEEQIRICFAHDKRVLQDFIERLNFFSQAIFSKENGIQND